MSESKKDSVERGKKRRTDLLPLSRKRKPSAIEPSCQIQLHTGGGFWVKGRGFTYKEERETERPRAKKNAERGCLLKKKCR